MDIQYKDMSKVRKGSTITQKVVVFENGKNLSERKIKRGYLNKEEENVLMMAIVTHQLLEGIRSIQGRVDNPPVWEAWMNKGMMTAEQRKFIKTANTYLDKFTSSIFNDNLDVKTKDKILKKIQKWDIRVIDDYTLQKLYRMLDQKEEYRVDRDIFCDLVETKMHCSCKNCTKDHQGCDFKVFLDDNFVPPLYELEEQLPNCEYAYNEFVVNKKDK